MRIILEPAFVLHYRPYRETSLIIDFFTQNYGRIATVARGVRGIKSKSRGLLQPFNPLFISWQGKTELMTLSSVETNRVPFNLRGDCLLTAFYLNELLMKLLHKYDSYPKLYTIYQETLLELQHRQLRQNRLRLFEKKLLEELGYGLQLQHDMAAKPFMAEQHYYFHAEQGFKLCQKSDEINSAYTFLGKSLLALSSEQLDSPELLYDAKRIMRLAFAPLLGFQPLHSRKLFIEV